MSRLILLSLLALVLFVAKNAFGDNWSRFRGPNGAGVVQRIDLPATWTDEDYRWKITLPGKGASSPVAWGDILFITAADDETAEVTLLAVSASEGKTLWSRTYRSTPHRLHGANSYASSTPAADAQRVYLLAASPESLELVALSHAGKELWRRDLGPIDYNHGFGVSPIVHGDLVIVANDDATHSYVAALDASSGEPRWRRERAAGTESYATPALYAAEDGASQVIVNSTSEGMTALAPEDGAVLWQLPDLFPARCVASPVVADALVIAGSGQGGNGKNLSAVSPSAKPEVVYELNKSIPQVVTPVAQGDLLFIWSDRGVASCVDLRTGENYWTERIGGNYFSSPVVAGDKLLNISTAGECVVLAADSTYKLLGRTDLGEPSSATPAIHNDCLYLRTESTLACLPAQR